MRFKSVLTQVLIQTLSILRLLGTAKVTWRVEKTVERPFWATIFLCPFYTSKSLAIETFLKSF